MHNVYWFKGSKFEHNWNEQPWWARSDFHSKDTLLLDMFAYKTLIPLAYVLMSITIVPYRQFIWVPCSLVPFMHQKLVTLSFAKEGLPNQLLNISLWFYTKCSPNFMQLKCPPSFQEQLVHVCLWTSSAFYHTPTESKLDAPPFLMLIPGLSVRYAMHYRPAHHFPQTTPAVQCSGIGAEPPPGRKYRKLICHE